MTKTVSILVPDNLLSRFEAFLGHVPEMRDAMDSGSLVLSTDASAKPDIVLAPSLDSALQWGYNRDIHWPYALAHASVILGQTAEFAAGGDVGVIREPDLERRPNLVLETIAERLGFSRGVEVESPHVPKIPRVALDDMPTKIAPLRMYSEIPVQKRGWAYWPSFVFSTYEGPCPVSIDIMGRARLLFYGPFIVLPPGTWQVDLVFHLTEEALPYDYFIEIGSGDKFERNLYRPKDAGRQAVRLEHIARDRSHVEIKVGLLRAAFHGELKLQGAWLVKTD